MKQQEHEQLINLCHLLAHLDQLQMQESKYLINRQADKLAILTQDKSVLINQIEKVCLSLMPDSTQAGVSNLNAMTHFLKLHSIDNPELSGKIQRLLEKCHHQNQINAIIVNRRLTAIQAIKNILRSGQSKSGDCYSRQGKPKPPEYLLGNSLGKA